MTGSAREDTLGAIRRALGRGPLSGPAKADIDQRLQRHVPNLVPERGVGEDAEEVLPRFTEEAERVSASVARVSTVSALPAAIADYLARENLPARIRVATDPLLKSVPWGEKPTLEITEGASDGTDAVGVSVAFAGIAETGTLVLLSGPANPTTLNLLPDTHVVVVPKDRITGAYETVWKRLRGTGDGTKFMPRTINWITGPSRTADIEQDLLLGAHGPRRLHILILDEDAD